MAERFNSLKTFLEKFYNNTASIKAAAHYPKYYVHLFDPPVLNIELRKQQRYVQAIIKYTTTFYTFKII